MSDFTNDLRYPKSGSLLFDTKDLVDVTVSKTGDTRSMTATYTDPETGEVLQTSEGGGGGSLPDFNVMNLDGTLLTRDDCISYGSNITTNGRFGSTFWGGYFGYHFTENAEYTAEVTINGTTYHSSATATKNSFTNMVNLYVTFEDAEGTLNFVDSESNGISFSTSGFNNALNDLMHTEGPTIAEALTRMGNAYSAANISVTHVE